MCYRFKICHFLLLLLSCLPLEAVKHPTLENQDVVEMLQQMMDAHVSCKNISPALIKRALEHYLEEIDPAKIYFLKNDVEKWLEPRQELLDQIAAQIMNHDFSLFFDIQKEMKSAIKRREFLESKIDDAALTNAAAQLDFKKLDWALCEDELFERLATIRALQLAAAKKIDLTSQELTLARIQKNRRTREEELSPENDEEKKRLVLSLVLKAFASSFDAHTSYFTPYEAAQFTIQMQQRLFGIGAQLRDDLNGFTVVKIIEGGPASRSSDLKASDRIIAVNGEPVVGLSITDAVERIRGEEGSKVLLTVLRPSSEEEMKVEIEIERGEVIIHEARLSSKTYPFADGVIAHITLHAFYQDPEQSSTRDLLSEIKKIERDNKLLGIILDLRTNTGGILPQAVGVTGLFITKGIVCSIKDNHGTIEHLREVDSKTAFDGPLIILASKASASASEIVAQTLQDYGRAIIVGDEHTYGKGSFQTFTLDAARSAKINPKGEFKVTRGSYYTVSGKSPQLVGVKPDIFVPGIFSEAEIGERHAKNPLENDCIAENFNDELLDIPAYEREKIGWLYRFNLQAKIKTFVRHLPQLKKNSAARLENNAFYQQFLACLKQQEPEVDKLEPYLVQDPQLCETVNIMKDLIVLTK